MSAGNAWSEQVPTAEADRAVLEARFAQLKGGIMTTYAPAERAAGKTGSTPPSRATAPKIAAPALDAAEAYARANRSTAFIVWRDGAIERETYFGETKTDTPLVSKSLSKPLGVVLVGRAIQLGYIKSLDQPVADFIPEWKGDDRSKILIRHLLDMRTGLMPQGPAPTADHILNRAYLSPRHEEVLIAEYPLVAKPGERFDYSNANAELVAIVLERAAKQRFSTFLSQQLLQPTGAPDVSVWLNRPGGVAHAGCCMMTPAQTWLRLAILIMDDGVWNGKRLLPKGFVTEMRTATPQNPHVGMGLYLGEPYAQRRGFGALDVAGPRVLHSEPYLAKDLVLFDGNSNQVVYIAPSRRLIVLRLGETPPASPEWDNAILPNTILRGLEAGASSSGVSK
ncbi:serine hydrolase [Caulobacter sp. BP25]|uniref:serine hydrolase domain-containing protein n=1 Tax=Caulobacter sp. BP25 TaxID=2048900 RepID=UPI0013748257|nr:serine hydrolase [Caulobacter sp. BP25]